MIVTLFPNIMSLDDVSHYAGGGRVRVALANVVVISVVIGLVSVLLLGSGFSYVQALICKL